MFKLDSKLTMACSAAVLALAMTACSSSSDDNPPVASNVPEVVEPEVVEPEVVESEPTPAEQLTAANAALIMAQGLVDALTSASTAEEAAAAYSALGAAQVALHAATSLPANQIAALQAQIDQLVLDLDAANSTPSTETVALEQAHADAATAATEAMEAATAAKVASDAAQTARENRATLQTGEKSGDLAHAAYMQAKAAADAAEEAQTAPDAAAEATNSVEATRQLVMAEAARDNAVLAQGMAETQSEAAVAATMTELMIVGTVKTVGGTSIDAAASRSIVTTGEGTTAQVEDTGLQVKTVQPMHTVGASAGVPGVAETTSEEDEDTYVAPVAGAEARAFPIGKLVDSADDTARLMIVTKYAGSKTVKVYAPSTADMQTGTMAGFISSDADGGEDTTNDMALKSEGTYYPAGDGMLEVTPGLTVADVPLPNGDFVAAEATGKEVFSYMDDDTKMYVVATTRLVGDTTTTYNYANVDIHVTVDADGDPDTNNDHEVTAKIPEATDYQHIHFGVWAALKAAKPSGVNDIADLGIGFVQSIGDGLTGADMPNNGTADYSGNWAAAVQRADEEGNGAIVLDGGAASLKADFEMDEITATLTGLATLSGDISGNTFKGDTAKDITHGRLDSGGKFTGEFSGGFYGTKAAEAGGIFDFTSEDAEDGAFRGSFGGDRVPGN